MHDISSTLANSSCISGSGVTAELTALRLAQDCVPSVVIGGQEITTPAAHTVALWQKSVEILESMDIPVAELEGVYPINGLCLVDEKGREDLYMPERAGLASERFGYHVPLISMHQAARTRLLHSACSGFIESKTEKLIAPGHIRLANGEEIKSRLLIVAEGKDSDTALQAGIRPLRFHKGFVAVIARVQHENPHEGISFEFFRKPGPLAFVPMDEHHSSIVWLHKAGEDVHELIDNPEKMLARINTDSRHRMHVSKIIDTPKVINLSSRQALTLRAKRLALVGEAAHKMPPTGAQGLNLTLRDIDLLGGLVGEAFHTGEDIGASSLLSRYSADRLIDNIAVNSGVHLYHASIQHGGVLALARQQFQHKLLPKFPKLRQQIIHKALFGFSSHQ